eukprot:TRINITY_DN584_c0_g1_i9.p1 TRINITY_DN584_c0_g1~~TRINITY_DN584_c0_g1_i9.p1  ORF type:complete len:154 (+),score=17.22 TRINITY_DN584_c0_g1_i9:81-542(+)
MEAVVSTQSTGVMWSYNLYVRVILLLTIFLPYYEVRSVTVSPIFSICKALGSFDVTLNSRSGSTSWLGYGFSYLSRSCVQSGIIKAEEMKKSPTLSMNYLKSTYKTFPETFVSLGWILTVSCVLACVVIPSFFNLLPVGLSAVQLSVYFLEVS